MYHLISHACADPEGFVSGGPTLSKLTWHFFGGWGGGGGGRGWWENVCLPAKRHLNEMAFRWRADDGPTVNADWCFVIFQGIHTSIAKKPYILVIFRWAGSGSPVPHSGSAHVMVRSYFTTMSNLNLYFKIIKFGLFFLFYQQFELKEVSR